MIKKFIIGIGLLVSLNAFAVYYSGISAGFFNSGDLKTWGGGGHAGYVLSESNLFSSGVELEILALHGHAYSQNAASNYYKLGALSVKGDSFVRSAKLSLTQIPIMINYRLWGKAIDHLPIEWYAGVGLGFQWMKSHYHAELNGLDAFGQPIPNPCAVTMTPNCRKLYDRHQTDLLLVCQLFAGVAYQFNEKFTINLGTRLMASKGKTWQEPTGKLPCEINTGTFQLGLELGLNYQF